MSAPMELTKTHRILIGVVVFGAVVIAGIGFAGSYAAVRELALQKGFGKFSYVFPIGIDAGICVLLALDLLLTWIRIPFPLLRQTAWLLTAATIAFNGAAAWPDPLGVGMHGVIPILFVVSVEAARHAIGRIADITADKHMEGVRLTRWLLSPLPTFLLWRRMKLWELRSYEQVIKLEQERLVYQARLRSRFGRAWRRKAPVESLMPLRLARYGVPLAETAPSGLAAAGIEPALLPPAPRQQTELERVEAAPAAVPAQVGPGAPRDDRRRQDLDDDGYPAPGAAGTAGRQEQQPEYLEEEPESSPWFAPRSRRSSTRAATTPRTRRTRCGPSTRPQQAQYEAEQRRRRTRTGRGRCFRSTRSGSPLPRTPAPSPSRRARTAPASSARAAARPAPEPDEESYYQVFKQSINGSYPTPREFGDNVEAEYRMTLPEPEAKRLVTASPTATRWNWKRTTSRRGMPCGYVDGGARRSPGAPSSRYDDRRAATGYSPSSFLTRSWPTARSRVGRRGPVSRPTSRW